MYIFLPRRNWDLWSEYTSRWWALLFAWAPMMGELSRRVGNSGSRSPVEGPRCDSGDPCWCDNRISIVAPGRHTPCHKMVDTFTISPISASSSRHILYNFTFFCAAALLWINERAFRWLLSGSQGQRIFFIARDLRHGPSSGIFTIICGSYCHFNMVLKFSLCRKLENPISFKCFWTHCLFCCVMKKFWDGLYGFGVWAGDGVGIMR